MSDTTTWTIDWITKDKVEAIARKSFAGAIRRIKAKQKKNLQTDPTLVIALNALLDMPYKDVIRIADDVSIVKTLQNAIGDFHQAVLGAAHGWNDSGSSGGVFDIYSDEKIPLAGDRNVVAEVKMRYNTIKASDEAKTWDKLKDAVNSRGGSSQCVAYLIQIVPKTQESYDRPWKVSGRNQLPYVRCIDGTTAYHLVTGEPDALNQLLHALPAILKEIIQDPSDLDIDQTSLITDVYIDQSIQKSLPPQSALVEDSR
ncbi:MULTISPECIES: Eco47II family restriction endonuclease [unclassified Corynebacterium]|uniref:Eco47II family restriction endonuclease n=1 Tax=unclassified Corynebacterium TaxID=2624378 RepID=UPI001EF562E5|nr:MULTISPECIES: Eco47II family restriction endonuclease [unclassified Corynebacterium]MCG7259190.1 Eco47II family restriction endonuclease [Corynebacterium sp. ACRQK]MCG7263488.1 Eco47II family restriction endonuclease [Corynebacterium sp. ACRQL]